MLMPVARLLSAWLAQPSAPQMMEVHDRACSLAPVLHGLAERETAEWAKHLRKYTVED